MDSGFANTGAHQHGIAVGQWPRKTLSCRGEYFKCQFRTTHMGAVGCCEPHGSSPTACAGKADHGFVLCVPLALICVLRIVKTVLPHKELEIPDLCGKFFEILKFVFLSEVVGKSFCVKFSGLISKLKKSSKNHIKVHKYSTYRLIFGLFLKLKKLWRANEAVRIILLQRHKKFCCVIIFLSGMR